MLLTHTTWVVVLAVPGPVREFSAELEQSSGEVILNWRPPLQEPESVTQYIISYQRIGVGDCQLLEFPVPVEVRYDHFSTTSKRPGVRNNFNKSNSQKRLLQCRRQDLWPKHHSKFIVVLDIYVNHNFIQLNLPPQRCQ